jgi:hypothetical protein
MARITLDHNKCDICQKTGRCVSYLYPCTPASGVTLKRFWVCSDCEHTPGVNWQEVKDVAI